MPESRCWISDSARRSPPWPVPTRIMLRKTLAMITQGQTSLEGRNGDFSAILLMDKAQLWTADLIFGSGGQTIRLFCVLRSQRYDKGRSGGKSHTSRRSDSPRWRSDRGNGLRFGDFCPAK